MKAIKKILLTVICVITIVQSAFGGTTVTKSISTTDVTSSGTYNYTRSYFLYIPSSYNATTNPANGLGVYLHGFTEQNTPSWNTSGVSAIADALNMIFIVPQALAEQDTSLTSLAGMLAMLGITLDLSSVWNCGLWPTLPVLGQKKLQARVDDVAFIKAIMDLTLTEYTIDSDNKFVTGFSLGGFMSHQYAMYHGNELSGIMTRHSSQGVGIQNAAASVKVPLLAFNSEADETVSYTGGTVNGATTMNKPVADVMDFWKGKNATNAVSVDSVISYYTATGSHTTHTATKYTWSDPNAATNPHSELHGGNEVILYKEQNTNHSHRFSKTNVDVMDYNEELTKFIKNHSKNIKLNKTAVSLVSGATEQLSTTLLLPTFDSNTVTWSSDDNSVATVDATGLVTAIGQGTATITATTPAEYGSKTATCVVDVDVFPFTTTANPVAGGTISGTANGKINTGDPIAVTAIPNSSNYIFNNWTNGSGTEVETNTTYSGSMPAAALSLTANFTRLYAFSTTHGTGGTIDATSTSDGNLAPGTPITVKANRAAGYAFKNWTNGSGTGVSTSATYGTTMPAANLTLTANFELLYEFTRYAGAGGSIDATSTSNDSLVAGASITVKANADAGYIFKSWTDGTGAEVSTSETYSTTMPAAALSLTANFTPVYQFTKTVVVTGGTIDATNSTADGYWPEGKAITVIAIPTAPDYIFKNWTDGTGAEVSTSETYSTTMPAAALSLTANFTPVYQFTKMIVGTGGTIDATNSTADGYWPEGKAITVIAIPTAPDYIFKNWTDGTGAEVSTSETYSTTMPAAALSLTANFTPVYQFTKTVVVTGGTIDATNSTADGYWPEGKSITVIAIPTAPDYIFKNWTDATNTEVSTAISFDTIMRAEPMELKANFTRVYAFSRSVGTGGGGTISGTTDGYLAKDAAISVTAIPSSGYTFKNWTDGTNELSQYATYTPTMPEAVLSLVANFAPVYAFSTVASPVAGGTVSGTADDDLEAGTPIDVTASANAGYIFKGWTVGADTVSKQLHYDSHTMPAQALTLTANFARVYAFSTLVDNGVGGSVSGTGNNDYEEGTAISVAANPDAGYIFDTWTVSSSIGLTGFDVTQSASQTVDMPASDLTLTAFFTPVYVYSVSAGAGGTIDATSTADTICLAGTSITVSAIPNAGHIFKRWDITGSTPGGFNPNINTPQTFVMPSSNVGLTAIFAPVYTFNISAGGTGGNVWSSPGDGSYEAGAIITVTSWPNSSTYEFVNWTVSGPTPLLSGGGGSFDVDDAGAYQSFFMPAGDLTLTVNYAEIFDFNVSVSSGGGGEIDATSTPSGGLIAGKPITVKANPYTEYIFVNWTDGAGAIVSTNSTYTTTMPAEALALTANFNQLSYPFNVAAGTGGSIDAGSTAAGNLVYGASISVTATPDTGWEFVNWTDGNGGTFTDNPYTPTMPAEALSLTANFNQLSYPFSVTAGTGGSIDAGSTAAGNLVYGASISVTATPDTGWEFVNWTDGNGGTFTANPYTPTMPAEALSLTANFNQLSYPFNVTAGTGGSIDAGSTAAGNLVYGASITVTATPDTGWEFVNWTDGNGGTFTANPYTPTMPAEALSLTANFNQLSYPFNVTAGTGGSIDAGSTAAGNLVYGASISVTATPDTGWEFVNWTDGAGGTFTDNPYTPTMPAQALSLTANFNQLSYPFNVTAGTGGSIDAGSTTGGNLVYGTGITVTATADPGYEFVNWTDGAGGSSTDNPYSTTMPTGALSLTANFNQLSYPFNVTAGTGGSIDAGSTAVGNLVYGADITVTATPDTGWEFVNWTDGNGGTFTANPYTPTMPAEALSLTANFNQLFYPFNVAVAAGTGGSIDAGSTADGNLVYGADITVTATPDTGWEFVNWTDGAGGTFTDNPYTPTMPAEALSLTANFNQLDYAFSVTAGTGGSIDAGSTADGNLVYGASISVTATADTGWEFVNWTDGNGGTFTDNPYTPTMPAEALSLTANFNQLSYPFNVTAGTGGSIDAGSTAVGNLVYGASISVTATADPGYRFVNWTDDTGEVSTSVTYASTMPAENLNLTANFQQVYAFSASANPSAGGTITGTANGNFDAGTSISVTANVASGYRFDNWTDSDGGSTTSVTYTNSMPAYPLTATANFTQLVSFVRSAATGGTIDDALSTPNGDVPDGDPIRVVAIANTGYEFVNWTDGSGAEVSTAADYSGYMPTGGLSLTANFTQLYYTFNVAAGSNGAIGGTADGSSIAYGAGFTVTATPDTGYEFVNWTDGTGTEVSTNVTYSTTMPAGNLSLTANFTVKSFDFTVAAGTGGSIAPGSTTDGSLPYGTDFSVTATADPGYRFVNWTDDTGVVSTNVTYASTMPAENLNLTANFQHVYAFSTSANPSAGGTITGTANGNFDAGTSISVTANVASGYRFDNWTDSDGGSTTNVTYTNSMPAHDLTVTANFTQLVSFVRSAATGGTIDDALSTPSGDVPDGDLITVFAIANTGYEFVNWTDGAGGSSTDNPYNTTMPTGGLSLTANFNQLSYPFNVAAGTGGSIDAGSTADGSSLVYGASITVTATPNTGYAFVNWTDGNGGTFTANPYTPTMPAEALSLTANFTPSVAPVYTFSKSANTGGYIAGTASGNIAVGSTVSVQAAPRSGYIFKNWTNGSGTVVSTNDSYTVVPSGNLALTANFTPVYEFTKSVGLGGVTNASTPNGQYVAGTSITVAAVPSTNYIFSRWTATGAPAGFNVNNAASQTFNMPTSAVTLKANFTRVYAFSNSAGAGGSVSGTGNGNLQANASVSVTATPSSGYAFKNWTVVGTTPAGFDVNAATQTFAMPESALTLKANFVRTYAFSTTVGTGGTVYTTSANASLVAGTVITVAAIPNAGYVFTNWTVTGTTPAGFDVNKGINQTFTMPDGGVTLKANFNSL